MNRKNYLFLSSRFLSALADQIILFATPLVVYKLTNSLAYSGLAFAIEWIPRILALLFSGFLVDKIGARAVYIASDFSRALLTASIFLIVRQGSLTAALVLAAMTGLVGFFSEMAFVALEGSVPRLFGKRDLTRAQSILQTIDQTGQLAGPALATFLAAVLSIQSLFLIVSAVFLLSAFNTFLFLDPKVDAHSEIKFSDFGGNLIKGFQHVLGTPQLKLLSCFTILVNLILGVTLSVSAGYIQKTFAATSTHFGAMNMIAGVVGLVLFLSFAKLNEKFSLKHLGALGLLLICLGGAGLGFASNFVFYAAAFVCVLVADGLINIFIRSLRVQYIPDAQLGTVLSVLILLNFLAFPVAGLLVSAFAETLGLGNLFLLLAAFVGVSGVAILLALESNEKARRSFISDAPC